jgi:hypothetical protein
MAYTALNQLASMRGDDVWSAQVHNATSASPEMQMWTPQAEPNAPAAPPAEAQPAPAPPPSPAPN